MTTLHYMSYCIGGLYVKEVKTMGGKSSTDLIKKAIDAALPSMNNTLEANLFVIDNALPELEDTYDYARRSSKGIQHGFYPARRFPALEEEVKTIPQAEGENYIIQKVRQDFPNFANRSPQELKQFVDSGGYDRALQYRAQKQGR